MQEHMLCEHPLAIPVSVNLIKAKLKKQPKNPHILLNFNAWMHYYSVLVLCIRTCTKIANERLWNIIQQRDCCFLLHLSGSFSLWCFVYVGLFWRSKRGEMENTLICAGQQHCFTQHTQNHFNNQISPKVRMFIHAKLISIVGGR